MAGVARSDWRFRLQLLLRVCEEPEQVVMVVVELFGHVRKGDYFLIDLVLSVYLFEAAGPCLFCKPKLGSCGLRGLYESLQVGWLVEISEIL